MGYHYTIASFEINTEYFWNVAYDVLVLIAACRH